MREHCSPDDISHDLGRVYVLSPEEKDQMLMVIKLSNNKTNTQNNNKKEETSNVCTVHEKSGARILANGMFTFFSYKDFKQNQKINKQNPQSYFFPYRSSKQEEPKLDSMFLSISTEHKYLTGINQFQ